MSTEGLQTTALECDVVSNRFRAKNLEPTDAECARILARHPTLTVLGFGGNEKRQRDNDWRARAGLPLRVQSPLAPITDPDIRRQAGLVRACVREIQTNIGEPFSKRLCPSYVLQHAVQRWAGEYILNGAVIVGVALEDGCIVESDSLLFLSITREVQARLLESMWRAVDYVNGALACVGVKTPRP